MPLSLFPLKLCTHLCPLSIPFFRASFNPLLLPTHIIFPWSPSSFPLLPTVHINNSSSIITAALHIHKHDRKTISLESINKSVLRNWQSSQTTIPTHKLFQPDHHQCGKVLTIIRCYLFSCSIEKVSPHADFV